MSKPFYFGWLTIFRLGLVQTALGSIVVLTTSTLNRVMVVEWALPAVLPGALVGLHYAVQISRPRFGYGSDTAGRRTPWIICGMAVLASGGAAAAVATAWMGTRPLAGLALALLAFLMIGVGVGAAGTSLLALLAKRVQPARRGAAAAVVWLMMIAGFILTAGVAGHFLDPFSPQRLVTVAVVVAGTAFVISVLAILGVEERMPLAESGPVTGSESALPSFRTAMREAWTDPRTRRFTVFVFVSMLAYSMQDLILEPFSGVVFGLTPGQSTQLTATQHSGVLLGMLLVGALASGIGVRRIGSLRAWAVGGCLASALASLCLVAAALRGPPWPLQESVFALGAANGAFAVAAIGSMMALAGAGSDRREGTRMGLWGAAQAVAFGLGGFLGTVGVDTAHYVIGSPLVAYALVFAAQAVLFVVSAGLMMQLDPPESRVSGADLAIDS